jgi:hypothetical protein
MGADAGKERNPQAKEWVLDIERSYQRLAEIARFGTPSHFLGYQLNERFGLDLLHVPSRGSSAAQ